MEKIAQQQPDLIVSDIMMPEMRGDDLCQTLKNNVETSHIPVILLTALADRENILHGLDVKADSYMVKPFDIDILKANIASILANKEFIRSRFAQLNYRTEDLPKEIQEAPGLELDQEFLNKATEIVKKNLGKEFNVDDLCIAMGMSRSSLYNKVKALTDHSPSDFIRQIRMKEAVSLLLSKKYTIAEVSDLTGYGDPKYFTDVFKKHYGMSPSAYMKQEKK
jgi:YesN/AraC family two-component response regulator